MATSLVYLQYWLVLGVLLVALPACHSQNERVVRRVESPYRRSYSLGKVSGSYMTLGPNSSMVSDKYYRTLTLFEGRLFVGGKDQLFSLNPANLSLLDSAVDTGSCSSCSNYIRVIQPLPLLNNTLLECGTGNEDPYCQQRSQDLSKIDGSVVSFNSGESLAPFVHTQSSTGWLLTNSSDIFVGTYLMETAGDPTRPAISKSVLQSDSSQNVMSISVTLMSKDDVNVLSGDKPSPQFVGDPISYNGRVYFFYREVASEFVEWKAVYSRVAVVCENDKGGRRFIMAFGPKDIVTFVKARLECSTGTTFPYFYNEIRDIYHSNGIVFAVFATRPSEVASSAVCAYRLDEIEALFLSTSKFRAQISDGELWREVDPDPVTPRPVQCPNTTNYTDVEYSAILGGAQLMYDTAANKLHYESPGGAKSNPLLMIDGERFTQIVVDENVINDIDVMFIGTENGTVLKTYLNTDRSEAKVVEEISLDTNNTKAPVLTMLKSETDQAIFVGTDLGVFKVPFEHCSDFNSRDECLAIVDPYCSWGGSSCVSSGGGEQNLQNGITDPGLKILQSPRNLTRRVNIANQPVNLFLLAEAEAGRNLQVDNGMIPCPPCDSLPFTEYRTTSSGREYLMLFINGSSSENMTCPCSVVVATDGDFNQTAEFTLTADYSDAVDASETDLKELEGFDREIQGFKDELTDWKEHVGDACSLNNVQVCPAN